MCEDAKIKAVIEKYSDFFKSYSADVGQTVSGAWFFLEYDKEHNDYYSFIRFHTAKELEQLIAGLLADDLNCLLEVTVESLNEGLQANVIKDLPASDYDNCVLDLLKNLEVVGREYRSSAEKVDKIFSALSSIIAKQG